MNSVPQIKIDYTQIPAIECKLLFRTLAKAVDRFYADPKNRERFEKWKKSMAAKEDVL